MTQWRQHHVFHRAQVWCFLPRLFRPQWHWKVFSGFTSQMVFVTARLPPWPERLRSSDDVQSHKGTSVSFTARWKVQVWTGGYCVRMSTGRIKLLMGAFLSFLVSSALWSETSQHLLDVRAGSDIGSSSEFSFSRLMFQFLHRYLEDYWVFCPEFPISLSCVQCFVLISHF